jgi:hypothetical protein
MFDSLSTRRYIIPIGLYRTVRVDLKAYNGNYKFRKTKGKSFLDAMSPETSLDDDKDFSTFKYVVTNPEKDTKLRDDDMVFVLAKVDPGDPENWDDFTINNKEMFDAKQNKIMSNINNMMH